ncbi:MAG: hypothetical protein R2854_28010 [Caldilineaceae bacterium]
MRYWICNETGRIDVATIPTPALAPGDIRIWLRVRRLRHRSDEDFHAVGGQAGGHRPRSGGRGERPSPRT